MPANTLYRWAHWVAPAAVLAGLLALRVSGSPMVEAWRNQVFDEYQRRLPRPYEDAGVRIIDIDDETLARLGQWPWPRTLLARLVRELRARGAAVVAFDAVFPESDRTSPAQLARLWAAEPATRGLAGRLAGLPDHDALFARAAAEGGVVTGFVLSAQPNAAAPILRTGFRANDPGAFARTFEFAGATANLPAIERGAAGNGFFNFVPDRDGIVRRVPLLARLGETVVPSLSMEALRVAQGARGYTVTASPTGLVGLKVGSLEVPTDEHGRVWVRFADQAPGRVVPAWEVFEKDFDAARVAGAVCFVGTSAAGLKDLRATPLNPAAAGVEVHANIAEQALLGRFLERPDWADGAEFTALAALGGLLILLLPRLGAALSAAVAAAGAALALGLSWHAFARHGLLFDPLYPAAGALLIYMVSSLVGYLQSETERRQIKGAFSRYMSPRLAEQIARHPEKLKLGGETREMTFHFCDIRGFTTISERFDPQGLTQFINRFLTPMTEIIFAHNGIIDKYMGDCIMAFWNAPHDDPDHARNACRAALMMHAELARLNDAWRAEAEAAGKSFVPIAIGTGLNSGPAVVGNMGSDQRFDYSVLGDDVNLASRLEGQSKTYGVGIVIGPRTREAAPEFAALELDLIQVKGKTVPVRIFGLLGGPELAASSAFRELAAAQGRALAAYRSRDWEGAEEGFAAARRAAAAAGLPLDALFALYDARIAACRERPPAADWDGSYAAAGK